MSIGLKRGTVAVEPHKIEWEISAKETISLLKQVLQRDLVDAQHIGSTAIQSICAKPIVDIVVGVRAFDDILKYNDALAEKGIFYRREDHPGQHLYVCGDPEHNIHTHYIHVVIWEQDAWHNYLNMRDYLNTHADKAREYSELKTALAQKYADDRTSYTNGKAALIEEILQCAREWRKHP